MSTFLVSVVFGANDHIALARFWAEALRVDVGGGHRDEAWITPPGGVGLEFVPIPEKKSTKNRIHLDLHSESAAEHEANVRRLIDLGATHVDIGQGDIAWTVLADPEGNEFCVEAVTVFDDATGPIGAIAHDAVDPSALSRFWAEASGWRVAEEGFWGVSLRAPSGTGPFLIFWPATERTAEKPPKNRLHIDVAPHPGGDPSTEVDRLASFGAGRIDIGQGDVPWIVMADPEGNEFCVLTPRSVASST